MVHLTPELTQANLDDLSDEEIRDLAMTLNLTP